MSLLFRLLLGHTIGDFALQTIDLVRYKSHSWKGLLLHSGIVLLSTAAFVWNIPWAWPWLIPLFALHVLVDWGKVNLSRWFPQRRLSLFLLDQLLHVGAIVGVAWLADPAWPYASLAVAIGGGSPEADRDLLFVLAFLAALFVVPLLEVQVSWKLVRPTANSPIGDGQVATIFDRLWGGAERSLVLALLYIALSTGRPAVWFAPLAFLPRIISLWQAWKQPTLARSYLVKIATSITCVALLGVLLWFIVDTLRS